MRKCGTGGRSKAFWTVNGREFAQMERNIGEFCRRERRDHIEGKTGVLTKSFANCTKREPISLAEARRHGGAAENGFWAVLGRFRAKNGRKMD